MDDELLCLLINELGKILQWEEKCPGVYYLGVVPEDGDMGGWEYYAVFDNAPISEEVRAIHSTKSTKVKYNISDRHSGH